ncbi:shikimate kinase [Estrella lausannensis]|nr:shikimate kinase [Estrella lausannensis]
MGLPRAGKTTFGKELASRLPFSFIDLDAEILRRVNSSAETCLTIKELYLKVGERAFRQMEEETLSCLDFSEEAVVSLGGGALISKINRELVKRCGRCIYLKIPETAWVARLQENPLVFVKEGCSEAVSALCKDRRCVFEELADFTIDWGSVSFDEAVIQAVCWLQSLTVSK